MECKGNEYLKVWCHKTVGSEGNTSLWGLLATDFTRICTFTAPQLLCNSFTEMPHPHTATVPFTLEIWKSQRGLLNGSNEWSQIFATTAGLEGAPGNQHCSDVWGCNEACTPEQKKDQAMGGQGLGTRTFPISFSYLFLIAGWRKIVSTRVVSIMLRIYF